DVTALTAKGQIVCVECKSGAADFQADKKWGGYLEWCDEFYFAVDADFPIDLLPPEQGLIIADGFGAEIIRPSVIASLAAARRKAQVLRIGRATALRLRAITDPGLSRFLDGSVGEDQPGGEA
ncbi:MAG: MmcB family DNA repair protein, partial [Pikeienuella sp.]